jgi:exopolysaccharide production protein ExoQ
MDRHSDTNHNGGNKVSSARDGSLSFVTTWLICIVLLVFSSNVGFSFERGSINTVAGSQAQGLVSSVGSQDALVMRIQTLSVYAICAILCLSLLWSITAEFRRDKLISLILAWAILSTVWSQNPTISLQDGLFLAMNIALAFYLLDRFSYDGILRLLVWVGATAALASLLVIVVLPQYGLMSRGQYGLGAWEGIYGHKNICGEAMGLLLMPIFFAKIRSRYALLFRVFYVILISIIIVMSRTVGAYIICASSVLLIAVMKLLAKMRRADAFALSVLLIAVALGGAIMAVDFVPDVLSLLGKDPTLTGRTAIWGAVMMSVLKKPLIGYGYRAFWQGLTGESANPILSMRWTGLSYSENGVLDLWLDLGGIGVALYVCVFLRAVKDAAYCLRRDASPFVMWCTLMLFTVVISNVEGGTILVPSSLACILPIMAFAGLRRERLRLKAAEAPTPIAHTELGRLRHEATRLREPELV